MSVTVNAVVKNGRVKLEKPLSFPEGTKAVVTFYPNNTKESRREWLKKYYQRTKDIYLDEEYEKAVKEAQEYVNAWKLPNL